uniref:Uncharacterized protein LOC107417784 n=1 Tax=Rhizophora mucronata TaxID=61149 RepID=A0A2P2PHW7_RHIMU
MEDGEIEHSKRVLLQNHDSSSSFHGTESVDAFLDEFLKNTRTCTHTHTCNPPGPDSIHTHTCYHTHTQVISSEEDDNPANTERSNSKTKKPSGNREAVRKYREKKKAHTAYLEDEVKKLQLLNQQLLRKLQGQAILEAEVLRLRSLLVDLKGKIDNELGAFPFQKQCNTTTIFKEGDCGLQSSTGGVAIGQPCQIDLPCLHPQVGSSSQAQGGIGGSEKLMVPWEGNCQPAVIHCQDNINGMANAGGRAMDS